MLNFSLNSSLMTKRVEFVIRGLSYSIEEDIITKELSSKGYKVRRLVLKYTEASLYNLILRLALKRIDNFKFKKIFWVNKFDF